MVLTTTDFIPGQEYQLLGLVRGSTVQSKHMGKDFMAGLKNMVGGELTGYTEMLSESRDIATQRMMAEATAWGADAIVGVRFSSASITQGAAEITAYGTAVRFNKE